MTDLAFAARRACSLARLLPGDVARHAGQLVAAGRTRLLADPPLPLLTLLRRLRPTLSLGALTLHTAGADVERILRDDDTYRVTPYASAARDLVGEFALGVDGPRHARLRADLVDRLERAGQDLQPWADAAASRILAEATAAGVADPVAELAARLPAAFVTERRLAPPSAQDPEDTDLTDRVGDLYEACFANLARDRGTAARGRRASAALAARGLTTEEIGLVVGAIPTTCEAVTRAVGVLRGDAERWARVRRAAARDDHGMLWAFVAEALRFSPQAPALVRAPAASPDRLVVASTYAAMHDPARVAAPARFRTDRPDEVYLHFGTGAHRCPGEHIARTLLTAAVRAVAQDDVNGVP